MQSIDLETSCDWYKKKTLLKKLKNHRDSESDYELNRETSFR